MLALRRLRADLTCGRVLRDRADAAALGGQLDEFAETLDEILLIELVMKGLKKNA